MENFDIPVTYKGEDLLLPAEFLPMGYSYKIKVMIQEVEILFEPDEEKNYRATVNMESRDKATKLNVELLSLVSETLKELLS